MWKHVTTEWSLQKAFSEFIGTCTNPCKRSSAAIYSHLASFRCRCRSNINTIQCTTSRSLRTDDMFPPFVTGKWGISNKCHHSHTTNIFISRDIHTAPRITPENTYHPPKWFTKLILYARTGDHDAFRTLLQTRKRQLRMIVPRLMHHDFEKIMDAYVQCWGEYEVMEDLNEMVKWYQSRFTEAAVVKGYKYILSRMHAINISKWWCLKSVYNHMTRLGIRLNIDVVQLFLKNAIRIHGSNSKVADTINVWLSQQKTEPALVELTELLQTVMNTPISSSTKQSQNLKSSAQPDITSLLQVLSQTGEHERFLRLCIDKRTEVRSSIPVMQPHTFDIITNTLFQCACKDPKFDFVSPSWIWKELVMCYSIRYPDMSLQRHYERILIHLQKSGVTKWEPFQQLYDILTQQGARPNDFLLKLLLDNACRIHVNDITSLKRISEWVQSEITKHHVPESQQLLKAFLNIHIKSHESSKAQMIWNKMQNGHLDISAYNIQLTNLARQGDLENAETLLNEMNGKGVQPNAVSYLPLLAAYSSGAFSTIPNWLLRNVIHELPSLAEQTDSVTFKRLLDLLPDLIIKNIPSAELPSRRPLLDSVVQVMEQVGILKDGETLARVLRAYYFVLDRDEFTEDWERSTDLSGYPNQVVRTLHKLISLYSGIPCGSSTTSHETLSPAQLSHMESLFRALMVFRDDQTLGRMIHHYNLLPSLSQRISLAKLLFKFFATRGYSDLCSDMFQHLVSVGGQEEVSLLATSYLYDGQTEMAAKMVRECCQVDNLVDVKTESMMSIVAGVLADRGHFDTLMQYLISSFTKFPSAAKLHPVVDMVCRVSSLNRPDSVCDFLSNIENVFPFYKVRIQTWTAMLANFRYFGDIKRVQWVITQVEQRKLNVDQRWNKGLVRAFAMCGEFDRMFRRMSSHDDTSVLVVEAVKGLIGRCEILKQREDTWEKPKLNEYQMLLDATERLMEMAKSDHVNLSRLLKVCVECADIKDVSSKSLVLGKRIYDPLRKTEQTPSKTVMMNYVNLLRKSLSTGLVTIKDVETVIMDYNDKGYPISPRVVNILIDAYCSIGDYDQALRVVFGDPLAKESDAVSEGNAVGIATIMTYLVKDKKYQSAMGIYNQSPNPSIEMMNLYISALSHSGKYDQVRQLWTPSMRQHTTLAIVLDAFGYGGYSMDIDKVHRVVKALHKPRTWAEWMSLSNVYNSLIEALGRSGRTNAVESVVKEMKERGVPVTFKTRQVLHALLGHDCTTTHHQACLMKSR